MKFRPPTCSVLIVPLLLAMLVSGCGSDDAPEPEGIFGFIMDQGLVGKKEVNDLSLFRCNDSGPYLFVPSHAELGAEPPRRWAITFEGDTDISGNFTNSSLEELELRLHRKLAVERIEEDDGECHIESKAEKSWLATGGFISLDGHDRGWFELYFTPEDEDDNGAFAETDPINVDGCWVVSRDGTDCDSTGIPAASPNDEDGEGGEDDEQDDQEDGD